jgi:RNA polymerase subunit RPABC4/transcription elongation factor Spt4
MVVREPDNLCVICGAVLPEGRQVCPICGTKDNIEGYAQLIRKEIQKPAPEFKVDDTQEQAFRQGYLTGFNEGMKAACELKQQNEQLRRRIVVLENQARNTVDDVDGEFE